MGGHSGSRPTYNNRAFAATNLFNAQPINGKLSEPVIKGDLLYKVPQGFKLTQNTLSQSSYGFGYEIAFAEHNNEYYMAQGTGAAPFVITYKLNGTAWETLDQVDARIRSTGIGVALQSFNGTLYMAVAHTALPFVTVYYRMGNRWVSLGDITDGPAGNGRGASFCAHNGKLYLIVTHSTSPFVTTFVKEATSESWTKLANPPTLPASTGNGVSSVVFENEMYMAVAHNNSPFVRSYKWNDDTEAWVLISNPPTVPASTGNGVKLQVLSDGLYMSVAHVTAPFTRHYKFNTSTGLWENMPQFTVDNRPPTTAFKSLLFEENGKIYSTIAHNNEPFITTTRLDDGAWTLLDPPDQVAKHNFRTDVVQSYYMEFTRVYGELYMALSLQFQPFLKVYKWDSTTERWSENGLKSLFPSSPGAAFNIEAIEYNNTFYMGVAHAIIPFMSIYKRQQDEDDWNLMIRPATLPASTGNGCKFVIYDNDLYFLIAHTATGSFKMYKLNSDEDDWELITPPDTEDLPTGNGIEISARVLSGVLYVAVVHSLTPFVTTYTWNAIDGWTKLPEPTELPASASIDAAMKVYDGELHLGIVYVTAPRLIVYKWSGAAWEKMTVTYTMPSAGGGIDFEEYEGDFYMSVGHSNPNYVGLLKWDSVLEQWDNQSNQLPAVKLANASRTTLYNDGETLYFSLVSLDSPNNGRLVIYKRVSNNWQGYYIRPLNGEVLYGLRFFKFGGKLFLLSGTQYPPYINIYELTENPLEELWSKTPSEYYSNVGIAVEPGNKNDTILIQLIKAGN